MPSALIGEETTTLLPPVEASAAALSPLVGRPGALRRANRVFRNIQRYPCRALTLSLPHRNTVRVMELGVVGSLRPCGQGTY